MHFKCQSSIWPIDRTLSSATTLDQSGPVSDGNEGILHIPQSSSITGALAWDGLMSYSGEWLGKSYPSAEMQSVYSTAPADLVWDNQEPIVWQSSQVPWATKFLTNLKTWLLFGNVSKLNFLLYFGKYIKMYMNVNYFPAITWKENKINRKDTRGHCFVSTIVKHLCMWYIYIYIYILHACVECTKKVKSKVALLVCR